MTKRRALVTVLLLIVVGVIATFAIRGWQAGAPARAYDRLILGMSREQACDLIGAPPGNHRDASRADGNAGLPVSVRQAGCPPGSLPPWRPADAWQFDQHLILIWFDMDGKAVRMELWEMNPTGRLSFFQRFRDWLGL